mmetsp:Transcript_28075/g.71552  ORF Transcript_28075/g.71552 Transcript_28075/m.71552 type:complete len:385 (+) Transcript_28075:2212-3366(+)
MLSTQLPLLVPTALLLHSQSCPMHSSHAWQPSAHASDSSFLTPVAGSPCFTSDSPTRMAPTPAACTNATSSGVKMPLSPVIMMPRCFTCWPATLPMSVAVRPRSTLNVPRSRLLMPSRWPSTPGSSSTRASSRSVCTSIRHCMPSPPATLRKYARSRLGSTAAMSRMASAPDARALYTWYASTMNSLHSSGQATPASRMSVRLAKEPWKNFSSVSTLRHAAPPASYAWAMRTGSKSGWMTPLEGDAFFTSAISPGLPVSCARRVIAALKSRGGAAFLTAACSTGSGTLVRIASISLALYQTISSRMFWGLLRSGRPLTRNVDGPHGCVSSPMGGLRRIVTPSSISGASTAARTLRGLRPAWNAHGRLWEPVCTRGSRLAAILAW